MRRAILQGIEEGVFKGAVVCVARNGDPIFWEAHGLAETDPNERPMMIDTRFDLAGLTKVVATLPAVLQTVQVGRLSLLDPVARYVPEFATGVDRFTKGQITFFHLLSHTSGLPAWRPLYLTARGMKAYLRELADVPLEAAPGTRAVDSDLGYMLLGFALERIWDRRLDEVCERLVFGPLGLTQTCFAKDGLAPELCAATERGNEQERRLLCETAEASSFPWREHTICGEVHDGNAFYGLDGVGGHAGVFSTALDLTHFAELWVKKGIYRRERFLDATLVTLSISCHTQGRGQNRGLGFETGGYGCSIGNGTAKSVFGLNGFTGASLWCDPVNKLTAVVLSNRVHPRVQDDIDNWQKTFYQKVFYEA